MMAAISAADNNPGADIVIVEKNSVPGKKLSATGNGRCNLSNSSCPHHLFVLERFQKIGLSGLIFRKCYYILNVTRIRRLRRADGEPIALMDNLLPAAISPSYEDLEREGLYNLLRARGVVPATAVQCVGARNATAAEAEALGEKRRAALLTVTRTAYDASGAVIEHGAHLYRTSRYSFETKLFSA